MPVFKPEDLQDAKVISFSAQDMVGVTPDTAVADTARARLAKGTGGRKPTTPEVVKTNPPSATTWQGPFADYGQKTNLKAAPSTPILKQVAGIGAGMLGSLDNLGRRMGMSASPIRQILVDPQTGQPRKELDLDALSQPPAPLPEGNIANVTRDISGATGIPVPDPTNYGMPRMFSDAYDQSYKRLESGQSNADMFKMPLLAAGAYGLMRGAPTVGRAILPADIAGELATKAQRASLGTKPENFTHGATPDVATLQDPAGSVYRSQGRQLKGIQNAKGAELDALEKDMSAPKYQNKVSDPLTSISPVLDDAASRATPSEATKIAEFRTLVTSKIGALSQGTMQLNPAQLVQLKRWMDGFVSTYKDEPIGTVRDLAQNTYSAIRQHLEQVAPESSVRGQHIQSLIQAEDALHNKIYSPLPEAKTTIGAVSNMFEPIVPSTLARTSTAAAFKKMSGGLLDRPPIATSGPGATIAAMGGTPNPTQGPPSGGVPSIQGPTGNIPPPNTPMGGPPTTFEQGKPFNFDNLEVGQQVSGHTDDGILISGELKRKFATVDANGVPTWKALVLDPRRGHNVIIPAENLFDKLEGPNGPKAEPTEGGHTLESKASGGPPEDIFIQKKVNDFIDKMRGRLSGIDRIPFSPEMQSIAKRLRFHLNADDNLGFDSPKEAVQAILDHPDFADRWQVSDDTKAEGNKLREAFKIELAKREGTVAKFPTTVESKSLDPNNPFRTYSPQEIEHGQFDTRNPDNPFPSKFDTQQAIADQRKLRNENPEEHAALSPVTKKGMLERAKDRPLGTPPVIVDKTKPTNTGSYPARSTPARPEEMALVRDAMERLAQKYPRTIRTIGRVELIDDRSIDPKKPAPLAIYSDVPGGKIQVHIPNLRKEISLNGLNGADAVLKHELTHAAQHVLGVKGSIDLLEPAAYRNQFRTLNGVDDRFGDIPLSPKELKHGPESWRSGPPKKVGNPDQISRNTTTKKSE